MTVRPERTQGLGRGLAALIPQRAPAVPVTVDVPIARVRPNPLQPRKRFDADSLASLTASIGEHGVIQPIFFEQGVERAVSTPVRQASARNVEGFGIL